LYIEKILAPELQPGMVVVIDNASFHKSLKVKNLIEGAGAKLIYLPPYSPALNPIEHYWHKIKTSIRKIMRGAKILLDEAMGNVLKELSTC
jgi:transposase